MIAPSPPPIVMSHGTGGGPVPAGFAIVSLIVVAVFMAVLVWKGYKLTRDLDKRE